VVQCRVGCCPVTCSFFGPMRFTRALNLFGKGERASVGKLPVRCALSLHWVEEMNSIAGILLLTTLNTV
jgi:hypothetical protein